MLEKELRRLGMADVDLEKISRDFDFKSAEDLYVAIGCGDIGTGKIINRLNDTNIRKDPLLVPHAPRETKPNDKAVSVLGLKAY
jgi:GTP pyrophosphokinase